MPVKLSERQDYRDRIYERYATLFQDAPEEFDEQATRRWGDLYRHYLNGWLPKDKKAQIVDLACGGGKLLYFFKCNGYENFEGVDLSPEQVKLARQVAPDVHEADVLDWLEANPGRFDLITGLDIVEHFKKPEVLRFLDASFHALKPGGRLVLQTPNADSPWGLGIRYGDFTHEVGFNTNSLTRLLRLTGFDGIEARETGPVPWGHSWRSTARYAIWQMIRCWIKIWNLAELGDTGSGVFTRSFLISGVRARPRS